MNSYDMVVIGGGPAGSMAAFTAADNGLSVLLVERDLTIGHPVRCAEAVDHKGLSEFFEPDPSWVATDINGYNLVAPDGTVVKMDIGDQNGYILERQIFDRMVAERAACAGAEIMTGVEAVALSEYSGGCRTVRLKDAYSGEWDVKARIVIAADGIESLAARWAGLQTHVRIPDLETCAQVTLSGVDIDPHSFLMYFTRKHAPGGYGWVFPKGDHTANVGLGVNAGHANGSKPRDYLDGFLKEHFPGASVVSRTYGGVPCSGGVKKIVADGIMVCGDAAHMANPITGGGIINGLVAGKFAGETAYKALNKNGNTDELALKEYQKRCYNRIEKPNRRFHRIKEGIFAFPDNRFNEIAHEIIKLPVEKRTPIRVLRTALFNQPKLLLLLAKVVF